MSHDPDPYDGPITRADGRRPFNCYLWPLGEDAFWPGHEYGDRRLRQAGGMFHFQAVALADGRWSTDGSTYAIERNLDCYGCPCVYPTRMAALRVSAGRMIRGIRRAHRSSDTMLRLSHDAAQATIAWTFDVLRRETGRQARRVPALLPVVRPKPAMRAGLPLFDAVPSDQVGGRP
jgi:hypothetical protein